jgi:hypothetical protein
MDPVCVPGRDPDQPICVIKYLDDQKFAFSIDKAFRP